MKLIKTAESKDEIEKCFSVILELRPHFKTKTEYTEQVFRQIKNNQFQLVYLQETEIKAVGGIRFGEWLGGGKYMEIEDLVAKSGERSKGYGGELFDWITNYAKRENCNQIKLVSHVKRFAAHKFYLNKGMIIEAHYFSLEL